MQKSKSKFSSWLNELDGYIDSLILFSSFSRYPLLILLWENIITSLDTTIYSRLSFSNNPLLSLNATPPGSCSSLPFHLLLMKKVLPLVISGGASPVFMAGHRQVISRISKGSKNICIYNFIITTFVCQGGSQGRGISARAFTLAPPGVALPVLVIFLSAKQCELDLLATSLLKGSASLSYFQ